MSDSTIEYSKQHDVFCHNQIIQDYVEIARFIGMDEALFLQKMNLNQIDLDDSSTLVPMQCIYQGYDLLLQYSQDELLGIGVVQLPLGSVDLMVKVASIDKTLEQGLRSIEQLIKISQSNINSTFHIEDTLVCWRINPNVKVSKFQPFITTICLSVGIRVLSLLIKLDIPIVRTSFTFEQPRNVSDYEFLFGSSILFSQPFNEICFDKAFLKKSIQVDYHQVKRLLKSPLSLVRYFKGTMGLSKQIKDILSSYPNANFPSPNYIAEQLGMSLRKMQRKLEQENTSYMQLKDSVRQQKAEFYLLHTHKNISYIAERCGFSESSSFHRSFKRWTGLAPSEFRVQKPLIHR